MTVMIGVDPHKATHTAVAIDGCEVELARLKVRASKRQGAELLAWADGFGDRAWAIESASGLGYLLAQQLLAAGETVLDVPATLAASARVGDRSFRQERPQRRRVRSRSRRYAAPSLIGVRAEDHVTVLRVLAKRNLDLARWRNKVCCRLHALVAELVPGGIAKEIVVAQASQLLEGLQPTGAAAAERHAMALELVEDLVHIDVQARESRRRITAAVAASGTTLTDIFGVGPVIAATLIGYTGDPCRFATEHRYAAYNGTAPIEFSSAGRKTHRLSWRGNRTLNHAIHMAAVTQIRHADSPGRGYYDRKVAEGKTRREALRGAQASHRRRLPAPHRRRGAHPPITRWAREDTQGTTRIPA